MTLRFVALLSACAALVTVRLEADGDVQPPPAATESQPSAEVTTPSEQASEIPAPAAPASAPATVTPPDMLAPPPASDATELSGETPVDHRQRAHRATPEEIASLLRIGATKRDQGDFSSAELAYLQVLAERATTEQDHEALLGLARMYRKKGDFTKAIAVFERFLKAFPSDPELPTVYLELGRTLRALGAYKQAIARFYSVLNSTLKLPDEGADSYRQLARTAQFEIAETYFQTGDYEQANRFFSRLRLLDLAPEDRARAHFKSVFALMLGGDDEKAIVGLNVFLEQYPDDENVPEARYLLSVALRRQGRFNESLLATLELLKMEGNRTQKDPRRWAYWQRKTGNQLANEFYQSGDIQSALTIYQNLAQLSSDPGWSIPVTYQMGLCHERLRRYDRAREAYQSIVDRLKQPEGNGAARPELADLAEMAAWRLGQIQWQNKTETQFSSVFNSNTPEPSAPPAASPPSASAPTHDHHGNTPVASHAVR